MTGKTPRQRLSRDDRRRQLVSIGLSHLVETPIQDLSLDDIASEAGISRGLLFHYFATKTDFYTACIEAAARRLLRNTAPSPDQTGDRQVEEMTRLMIEQIDRRRAAYIALVHGTGVTEARQVDVQDSMRTTLTQRVTIALALDEPGASVIRGWWAYVEERALDWSVEPQAERVIALEELTSHCCSALNTLLALQRPHRRSDSRE